MISHPKHLLVCSEDRLTLPQIPTRHSVKSAEALAAWHQHARVGSRSELKLKLRMASGAWELPGSQWHGSALDALPAEGLSIPSLSCQVGERAPLGQETVRPKP